MFLSLLDLLRQGGPVSGTPPVVDVVDGGAELLIRVSLPGIDPKSVQVQVRETSLAIGGRRTVEERTESPQSCRYQMAVSQFYREVQLPGRVDPRRAVARWEADGLLVLTLPRA